MTYIDVYKKAACFIDNDKEYTISELAKIIGKSEHQVYDTIRALKIPVSFIKKNRTRLLTIKGYDYKKYIVNRKDKKANIVYEAIVNNMDKIDINKNYSLSELSKILNVSIINIRRYIASNIDIDERKVQEC